MLFSLSTIIAVLPLLAASAPAPAFEPVKIPLAKRSAIATNGTVNVDALRNHLAHVRGKIANGFENYKKNTGKTHPNDLGRLSKRATGKVSLTDDSNELWQGAISVGTPAKTYTVDFDTGSSDLFLPGPNCGSTCKGHTIYDPSKSSTSKSTGKSFSLAYGDGSTVSGTQYTDTVTLGGLKATSQRLGVAKQYSDGFESDEFPPDGLLGMAFEQISDYNAPPVFQTLVSQGSVSSSVFGFTLLDSGSELYVGGIDSSAYSGSISYTDVTEVGYWQIEFSGLSVGSKSVLSGSTDAIVDTGTTLIIGDSSTVSKFYKQIPGAKSASSSLGDGMYTIPCDSDVSATVTVAGKKFTVSADTLNQGQVSDGSSTCVGGVAADDSMGFWILGDVFLSNVYTVFDVGNERVGFAQLK